MAYDFVQKIVLEFGGVVGTHDGFFACALVVGLLSVFALVRYWQTFRDWMAMHLFHWICFPRFAS